MAELYCDPTLYPAYSATPTWGTAQDGDGTAKTAATPATASVVFTGIPSSGAIAVLGVTLTPTWATSADVCANNLATAINASSSTATSPAGITRKSQVRNHLYARGPSGGAAAGTCEIMMRQGTAGVNGQIAVTHTLNNVSSAATINFAGGVGGAWGYLANMATTVWAQALAVGAYGLWTTTMAYVGTLSPGDVVHVRSNNVSLLAANQSVTLSPTSQGSATAPVTYLIDNNNKWADGANNGLTFGINNPNGTTLDVSSSGSYVVFKAARKADGSPALSFVLAGSAGGSAGNMYVRFGAPTVFENVDFSISATTNMALGVRDLGSSDQTRFINCRVRTGQSSGIFFTSFGATGKLLFEGGEVSNLNSSGGQVGAPMTAIGFPSVSVDTVQFVGTRFTNFVTGSRLVAEGSLGRMLFVDCDLGGLTVRSPVCYNSAYQTNWSLRTVAITSQQGSRDWSIDTTLGLAEWSGARSFPTRAGLLFDGVTKWSLRFCASTQSALGPNRVWTLPRIAKYNALANGSRTVTAHFVLEKGMTWTAADIYLRVQYIDTSGVLQTVTSNDPFGGALADDSAGLWSQYGSGADAANVVWNNAGNLYHKQYKIAVSCPNMATNTEVAVYLVLAKGASTVSQGGFLDPDFDIV